MRRTASCTRLPDDFCPALTGTHQQVGHWTSKVVSVPSEGPLPRVVVPNPIRGWSNAFVVRYACVHFWQAPIRRCLHAETASDSGGGTPRPPPRWPASLKTSVPSCCAHSLQHHAAQSRT